MNHKQTKVILKNRGAAIITSVLLLVIISATIAIGLSSPVLRDYNAKRDFTKAKEAYYLSEAGQEDAIYRIKKMMPISSEERISLNGNYATTTITDINAVEKQVSSRGEVLSNSRRVNATLSTTIGASFIYGVWVGAGGLLIDSASSITGNLYSAGSVCGGGENGSCTSSSGSGLITGTVISTGTTGLNGTIRRIQNQGGNSMYAGTIAYSTVSGTPYCNTNTGSTPSGCSSLSLGVPPELPITEIEIAAWETAAVAGGVVTCNDGDYRINSSRNFGPKKVPCDLVIDGGDHEDTLTLQGPIWVDGQIEIRGHVNIRVDPAFSEQSIVIIADENDHHHEGSDIDTSGNDIRFTGAPGGNSWVMLLSENSAASQGDYDHDAIDINDGITGDVILYSRLGEVAIDDPSTISQATAYRLKLTDGATIIYETGLANSLFPSGPGGAWWVQDWKSGQ